MKEGKYVRLLNGDKKPSERSILATIGTRGTKRIISLSVILPKSTGCYRQKTGNKVLRVPFEVVKPIEFL